MNFKLILYPIVGICGCVLVGVGLFSPLGIWNIPALILGGFLVLLTKIIEPNSVGGRSFDASIPWKFRLLFAIFYLGLLLWIFGTWTEHSQILFLITFYIIAATVWIFSIGKKWYRMLSNR